MTTVYEGTTMNKKALAAFGGLAAFGILTASAASLGGLTSSSLGADQTVIASCDTNGIQLTYTNTYVPATNSYSTTAVTMAGVDPTCATKAFRLSLSNGTISLGETTGVVQAGGGTQPITLTAAVDAKSVTNAALVIS
jgi:hypothetical protein